MDEVHGEAQAGARHHRGDGVLRQVRQAYGALAPFYDWVFGASLQHGRRLAVRALDCAPGERVLEVGVGTGLSLPLYPEHARITGVDISREMLARSEARVRRLRLTQVEALLEMDAEKLSFPDGWFDKAAVMYALSGLANPVRALREMMRVCRPGSTIVIVNHFRSHAALERACERLLAPFYRPLRYRCDLELEALVESARLEVRSVQRANLFGYDTVLVCRNDHA
ncbi:MAG TPA: methyltransferase domain-containing protein [Burkholderiales bacterium]|nr:methyltransferase domain-containing protein [Burkholderiales bacterium]